MARLKIYHNNSFVKEISLDSNVTYLAGRADHCAIVLEPERGISREHFQVLFLNGRWVLKGLSRFGELYYRGDKISDLNLQDEDSFEVPPYRFDFKDNENTKAKGLIHLSEASAESAEFDKTIIGKTVLHPYLKVYNHEGANVVTFQLDGTHWIAGRDTSCTIFIDNQKISRQQFEITFQEDIFSIRDLGSSNGTLLNGDLLPADNWTVLSSGDVISIADWTCRFEILDPNFESRLKEVPQSLPMIYQGEVLYDPSKPSEYLPETMNPANHYPTPNGYSSTPGHVPMMGGAVHPYPSSFSQNEMGAYGSVPFGGQKKSNKKTLYFRLGIVFLILGALYFYLDSEKPAAPKKDIKNLANLSPYQRLSKNQQELVKHSLRLSDRLYKEGNFELAKQEISKIHELLPEGFENSKEIEALAQTALKAMIDLKEQERIEKEQAEIKEKVKQQIRICSNKIQPNITPQEMDECLAIATGLDPNNTEIQELKLKVQQMVADREALKVRQEEYKDRVQKHKSIYKRAEKIHKDGKYLEAIKAYQDVLGSSLPDPEDLKGLSKRQISSIKDFLNDKQSAYEKQADAFYAKGEFKNAIQVLKKSIDINPDNESIPVRINSILKELSKQMQTIYQESILEEGVGEVEAAKVKWKKILEQSIPEEEYFKKAKIKLKKYGVIL